MAFSWSLDFLQPDTPTGNYALIILNQPFSFVLLETLWNSGHLFLRSRLRCCADGGANRLHRALSQADRDPIQYLPRFIKGDLDSIHPAVRQFYSTQNVPVIHDRDQNSTDLMKCITEIDSAQESGSGPSTIVILGGLSGRLDQTIHTLSLLHKLRHRPGHIFAITDENVGWVLDEGEHWIHLDPRMVGPTCGLLPVGISSTVLSTKGLVWNLDETESSFDGLVSTSNAVNSEHVWVKTTAPIWWCIQLVKLESKEAE